MTRFGGKCATWAMPWKSGWNLVNRNMMGRGFRDKGCTQVSESKACLETTGSVLGTMLYEQVASEEQKGKEAQ